MNIIVICTDHRRRAAHVEAKPAFDPVLGYVIVNGQTVKGLVIPTENLESILSNSIQYYIVQYSIV